MNKTVIIDYGMGNLRSVEKAFQRINVNIEISSDPKIIENADKLILPGVGNFEIGIANLNKLNLSDLLQHLVIEMKKPILGICLGMQLFTKVSEEGDIEGLGFIDAITKRFDFTNSQLKIPHIGWNTLEVEKESKLSNELKSTDTFYFVHSFYVSCNIMSDILYTTKYGLNFVSGFEHNNIIGTQFHPEKSHKAGLNILKNFIYHF